MKKAFYQGKEVNVGDKFKKVINSAEGIKEDGMITCVGYENKSILLKYEGCMWHENGEVEAISVSKAQKVLFQDFMPILDRI